MKKEKNTFGAYMRRNLFTPVLSVIIILFSILRGGSIENLVYNPLKYTATILGSLIGTYLFVAIIIAIAYPFVKKKK